MISRTQNQKANYLSKVIDFDAWRVEYKYFQAVTAPWGVSTIDCFTNYVSKKVPKFYSKFFSPGTFGIDAFVFDWSGEFCWLAPPLCLIIRVILQVCIPRYYAVLVVANWYSAVFWPYSSILMAHFGALVMTICIFVRGIL